MKPAVHAFGGIAFRLGAAMMFAALMSTFLIIGTIYFTVESRVRTPPPELAEIRSFFTRIAKLCEAEPALLGDCPTFIVDGQEQVLNAPNTATRAAHAPVNAAGSSPASDHRTTQVPSSRAGRVGLSDVFDPRPWILPTLILSTGFAAALALATALLIGRRIAQPI